MHVVRASRTQARKTTPPPPIKNNSPRRSSRSPEKKPEPFQEEQVSYPPIKSTRSPPPKSDVMLTSPHAHTPPSFLSQQQQQTASYPSTNDPSQRKPYVGLQDFPIQLPDYHSPYAYRGQKGHQDRNFNQTSFPAVPSNRKARPPLHEPRYRAEPIHYHGQSKAISLVGNAPRILRTPDCFLYYRREILSERNHPRAYGTAPIRFKLTTMTSTNSDSNGRKSTRDADGHALPGYLSGSRSQRRSASFII